MGLFSMFKRGGVLPLSRALYKLLSGKAPGAFAGNTSSAVKSLKNTCQKVADDQKGGSKPGALIGEKISTLNSKVQLDYLTLMEKVDKNPKKVGEIMLKHAQEGMGLLVEINTMLLNFKTGEQALELDAMKLNAEKRVRDLQKRQRLLESASVKVAAAKRGLLIEKEIVVVRKKMSHNLAMAEMRTQVAKKLRMKPSVILSLVIDWERWNKTVIGRGVKVKVQYKHP